MSTRCRIGLKMPDGKIKSIYSHWDGYPEGVGMKLEKYYQDPKKIEELLELGDISSLGDHYDAEISKADWGKFNMPNRDEFIKKAENCTIAYKDRGEDVPARIDENEEEYISKAGRCGEEYIYLFKEDYSGVYRWHVLETPWFQTLRDVFKESNKSIETTEKEMGVKIVDQVNIGQSEGFQFN